uniref:Aldehyde oxidase/xanthine dehydrogenase second molybdopterin binding domain-containing protein n=1 Tax=Chenopodium quinoa TaxID=63459 RepID=A0A803MH09_CHEQI
MVKQFNKTNIWRKKGISRLPVVHGVSLRPTPGKVSILRDGSIAGEVGRIKLGQGSSTSESSCEAVEVNLMTRETTILRSDIIYDYGQSVNPAVDLGQSSHKRSKKAWSGRADDSLFQSPVPAIMPVVKELRGLDILRVYIKYPGSEPDRVWIIAGP